MTRAAAVVISAELADAVPAGTVALVAQDPYAVFIDILSVLYPNGTFNVAANSALRKPAPGSKGSADRDRCGAGPGCESDRTRSLVPTPLSAGHGGRDCVIGAGAIVECAHLGNGVVLQPGVIGAEVWLSDGPRRPQKIPSSGG